MHVVVLFIVFRVIMVGHNYQFETPTYFLSNIVLYVKATCKDRCAHHFNSAGLLLYLADRI